MRRLDGGSDGPAPTLKGSRTGDRDRDVLRGPEMSLGVLSTTGQGLGHPAQDVGHLLWAGVVHRGDATPRTAAPGRSPRQV